MRWVKRRKSLHLHCVSRLHFVFRPLVWQRATVKSWPCNVSVEAARSFNRHGSCLQHVKSRFSPWNNSSCWLFCFSVVFFFLLFFWCCVVSPHTGTHDTVEQGFYFVTLAGDLSSLKPWWFMEMLASAQPYLFKRGCLFLCSSAFCFF